MPKRVLDVGNCVPDHAAIRRLLETQFQAEVTQTHGREDTLEALQRQAFDLVLVNRKLDEDYSDGMEIIGQIKAHPALAKTPCMLITNYAEQQEAAVAAGAEYGFGKMELRSPDTHEKLARFLTPTSSASSGRASDRP
jgi:CheY-like chemotaxis protein